ncbi:MAG TPA: (d)CMP kinase [Actinomycetota bacterium]|nr:(d)CMP kinase [Actinomycetota bacterium]
MSVIAIDGPAGAGKSTVAAALARALGWSYLDTGAMYRAVALAALRAGTDLGDGAAVARVARAAEIEVDDGTVRLDGADVTDEIRSGPVTSAAPRVAALREVRDVLVERQRTIGERSDVVMEGRDIGAQVVPDAALKVYLTATLDERARRRLDQTGTPDATREDVAAALARRDEIDASRAASPLARAPDAVVVDTTDLGVDDVVRRILFELERARAR